MKDVTSTSFGYVIGFLLPGLVAVYGLGYFSNSFNLLFRPAMATNATIGSSLILMVVALALGFVITAIRFVAFEKLLCKRHKLQQDLFKKLLDSDRLNFFRAVVDEHYRYHQFFGGFAFAFVPVFWGWVRANKLWGSCWFYAALSGFVLLEALMGYCAYDSYVKYVRRANSIVD